MSSARPGQNPCISGWIQCHTKPYGSRFCVATAGGVNPVARCQTWRFTTNSFAATPAMMPTTTLLHFALRVTPLRISAEEFLSRPQDSEN